MLPKLSIVVLISGNGSNLQAIIDAITLGLNVEILAVISNRADAYGLVRAQDAHIPTHVIDHQHYPTRKDFDNALIKIIDRYHPQLIVLAGFMRRLDKEIVQHYQGKMINIHPSLLPKYTGLNTHERVLAAREKEHGVSIHWVTDELDSGPVIAQASLTIEKGETKENLQKRIHALEYQLYPQVLQMFVDGKLHCL